VIVSVVLFLVLSPALFAPIVKVRAQAEGLSACCIDIGWQVRLEARIGAAGTHSSVGIAEDNGAEVTRQALKSLDGLRRRIHIPLFGNWWSVIFLAGIGLSFRRRYGAVFGAVAAFLGLVSVLAITGGIEHQIYAGRTFPLAINVLTTPFVGAAIAAWAVLLAWFLFRGALDRREEQLPRALAAGELELPKPQGGRGGHGPALAGAALGTVILGCAFLLAALPFAEDCAALLRELGEEVAVNEECQLGNFWFLGIWTLWGGYGGAVLGCGLGLRLARQPLPVITALFSAVALAFTGFLALGMTVTISLPLGLVLLPAALLVSVRVARALALRIAASPDRDFAP